MSGLATPACMHLAICHDTMFLASDHIVSQVFQSVAKDVMVRLQEAQDQSGGAAAPGSNSVLRVQPSAPSKKTAKKSGCC